MSGVSHCASSSRWWWVGADAAPTFSFTTTPNGGPVNVGTYLADFAADCNATAPAIDTVAAEAACVALGQGWHLASVASPAAHTAIAGLNTNHLWLGGSDTSVEGRFVWSYGRLKNTIFYDKSTGAPGPPYCKTHCDWWGPGGYPNNENDPTRAVTADALLMSSAASDPLLRRWADADSIFTPPTGIAVRCYACERSPCNISLDCNATNTLSVNTSRFYEPSGYCGCVCKDGFSGARCNDIAPLVNISGLYNAQYMVQCADAPIRWTSAAAACEARGNGWAFATIPTAEAQAAVAALSTDLMWLGGTDLTETYVWRWDFGRRNGDVFYRGRRGGGTCTVPPCACEPGMYCNWHANEPNGQHYMMMYGTNFPTRLWNDNGVYFVNAFCYACERSLCDPALNASTSGSISQRLLPSGTMLTDALIQQQGLRFYPQCHTETNSTTWTATSAPTVTQNSRRSTSFSASPAMDSFSVTESLSVTTPPRATRTDHSHTKTLASTVTATRRAPTAPPTMDPSNTTTTLPRPPPVEAVVNIANSTCPVASVTLLAGRVVDSVDTTAMRALGPADVTDALIRAGELVVVVTLTTPNTSFVDARVRFAVAGRAAVQDPRSLPVVVDLGGADCTLDRWGDVAAGTSAFQRVLCRLPASPRYVLSGPESIAVSVAAASTTRMCATDAWSVGTFTVYPAQRSAAVVAAVAVTTAATSVAVSIVIVFAEGSPIEIQLMVLLLASACGSGADAASMAVVRFFVSPFVTLGPAWMAVGNVLLAAAVALVHVGIAASVHVYRRSRLASIPSASEVPPMTPERASTETEAAPLLFTDTLGSLMFPGVSLAVAQVLYAGVAFGVAAMLVGERDARTGPAIGAAAAVLGILFLLAVPIFVLLSLRRWAAGVWYERYDWTGGDAPRGVSRGSYRRVWMRRADFNGDFSDQCVAVRQVAVGGSSSCISRVALRVQLAALPEGRWGPLRATRPLIGVLGAFRVREELWALLPLLLAIPGALLLTALPAHAGAGCENVFVAIAMLAFVVSVLVLLLRPHRALLGSLLTTLCLALLGGIAIAQVLAVQAPGADWPGALKATCVLALAVASMVRSVLAVWQWWVEPAVPNTTTPTKNVGGGGGGGGNTNTPYTMLDPQQKNSKTHPIKRTATITTSDGSKSTRHGLDASCSSLSSSAEASSVASSSSSFGKITGGAAASRTSVNEEAALRVEDVLSPRIGPPAVQLRHVSSGNHAAAESDVAAASQRLAMGASTTSRGDLVEYVSEQPTSSRSASSSHIVICHHDGNHNRINSCLQKRGDRRYSGGGRGAADPGGSWSVNMRRSSNNSFHGRFDVDLGSQKNANATASTPARVPTIAPRVGGTSPRGGGAAAVPSAAMTTLFGNVDVLDLAEGDLQELLTPRHCQT